MKATLRLILVSSVLALSSLRAESTAPTTPPAPAEPTSPAMSAPELLLTIQLPGNLTTEAVVSAVTKALNARGWMDVVAQNDTVAATLFHNEVIVKASAVCSATEVKLYGSYRGEKKNLAPGRAKAATLRWFRYVELSTKEELGLLPKKAKKK